MNRATLLFYLEEFFPENQTGGAINVYETTKRLKSDFNIIILTGTHIKSPAIINDEKIKIFRIYTYNNFFKIRFLRRFFFFISSIPIMVKLIKKNNVRLVNVNISIFSAIPALICAKLCNIKIVGRTHGIFPQKYLILIYGNFIGKIAFLAETIILRLPFDKLISVGSLDVLNYININKERTARIFNGVDVKKFSPLPQVTKKEIFVVGFFGSLIHVKGVIHLINAIPEIVSNIPNTKFLIYGEGPLGPVFKKRVSELHLDGYIEFLGHINHNEIVEKIHACDIVILPSLYENLPLIMLETIACGKVFIGTNVGGIKEIIKNYDNGILIEPEDPHQIAVAIQTILQDPLLQERIEKNARLTAESLTWDATVNELKEIYLQLINVDAI